MNSYQPATADMAFILETVLQESARFVGEVIAPLNLSLIHISEPTRPS